MMEISVSSCYVKEEWLRLWLTELTPRAKQCVTSAKEEEPRFTFGDEEGRLFFMVSPLELYSSLIFTP